MISLCIPYYDDPERLHQLMLNDSLDYFHEVILVDDASQKFPAKPIVAEYPRDNIILYRIHKDYGFNAHGARNLGASVATGDWVFFIDMDQVLTPEFCESLIEQVSRTPKDHFVWVCESHNTHVRGVNPNTFCARITDFEKTGGYDEEIKGWHMGDRLFRERLDYFCKPDRAPYALGQNRVGRMMIEDGGVQHTLYPDDYTMITPPVSRIQHVVDMIEERNKHPEQWGEIANLTFDFSLELL